MAQIEKLYVHRDRWAPSRTWAPGHVIHCAHRPLLGHTVWEGWSVGWGTHFAALTDSGKWPEQAWMENNAAMDAREVELITNFRALELAMERNAAVSSSYGLDVYVGELGREGAKEFVQRWELPWSDTDLTGDVIIARMSGGAA